MLLLLYGKDSYRIQEKIKEKISRNKGNVSFLEKKEVVQEIEEELFQNPMFKEKKLFVINHLWAFVRENKKITDQLKKTKDSEETTFIFREEKIDKKTESFFNENGKSFNFEPLKGQELKKWISKRIKEKGGEIDEKSLSFLIDSVGNDLWSASNEIDKLLAYKERNIEEKDIALLTSPRIEGDIFKAIDFLAMKNRKKAFDIFYRHLKKGDHILYLLTMIAFQFRNLILVKTNRDSNSRELKMHPFVFQKSVRQASFFSKEELKSIYRAILKTEVDIKTGKADPEAAFDFLIAKIS